jgi:ribonuclease BN (tRNA processing enzyme)
VNGVGLTFFGVRGSYPVADRRMSGVGGNTTSLLLEAAGETVIFDAGTGIIALGRQLARRREPPRRIHIFLTHLHIDHILGLPFFAPMFDPGCRISFYGPVYPKIGLRHTICQLFEPPFSPITMDGVKAGLDFCELPMSPDPGEIQLGPQLAVRHIRSDAHPQMSVLIYQLVHGRARVAFATDVENPDGFETRVRGFLDGVDVLIHDSQYLARDYSHPRTPKRGYGHSTVAMAAGNARVCRAGRLFLFHFDPEYDDATLQRMLAQARRMFPHTELAIERKKIKIRS